MLSRQIGGVRVDSVWAALVDQGVRTDFGDLSASFSANQGVCAFSKRVARFWPGDFVFAILQIGGCSVRTPRFAAAGKRKTSISMRTLRSTAAGMAESMRTPRFASVAQAESMRAPRFASVAQAESMRTPKFAMAGLA